MWISRRIQSFKRNFSRRHRELKGLSKLPRYTPGTFSWNGAELQFPDARSFTFMYRELFEEEIYRFKTQKKSPFIIDCGANIGMSAIYFKSLFPEASLIAFEPERKIFSYLKNNLDAVGLHDVKLVNKAVWKEDTQLNFMNEGADASRIASSAAGDDQHVYLVDAVRLSDYINTEVDFLKLDIEGAELDVLREIEPRLSYVERMFIEYHCPENGEQKLQELLTILSDNHFKYYIDSSFKTRRSPFVDRQNILSFRFFLNIYAEKAN